MFQFPLWGLVWLAKSLKRPFTESRGYPQQFVGNFVGKDIPMPLTHNTLMTLPLNKMIADTNGLYFKRTGPQKGTWTFRYMRHGRARTMSLGPYPVLSLADARKKLLQNRLLLSEGYDPLEERQKDQCKKGYTKGIRFSDVAKECIETRKSSWTNKKSRSF